MYSEQQAKKLKFNFKIYCETC